METCLNLPDAFQLIDNGSQNNSQYQLGKRQNNRESRLRIKNLSGTEKMTSKAEAPRTEPIHSITSQTHGQYNTYRPIPPCTHPICKSEGKLHWIIDCDQANEAEKNQMKKNLRRKKQRHQRMRKWHDQHSPNSSKSSDEHQRTAVRRLTQPVKHDSSSLRNPSCRITLSDGTKNFTTER